MQCTAKSKQSGERCKKHAVRGRRVCHIHGGKTPRGFNHPNTKTGQYSKYLNFMPENLRSRYDDLLNDPKLRDLSDKIAILDLRLSQLLEDIESGDYGSLYTQIQNRAYSVQSKVDKYQRLHNEETFNEFLDEYEDLMLLIQSGNTQFQAWQEIRTTITNISNLIKSEAQVAYMGENAIAIKEAASLFSGIRTIFERLGLTTEQKQLASEQLLTLWDYQSSEVIEDET